MLGAMEHIFRNYIKNKSNKENNNVSIPKIDVKKKDYDTIVKLVDNESDKPIITPIAKQKKITIVLTCCNIK